MRSAPIILLLLTGCGLVDRLAPLPLGPAESIRVREFQPVQPIPCPWAWDPLCNGIAVDCNQDGGVDGFDVEVFMGDYGDANAADYDRDGCSDVDNDFNGVVEWCDLYRWLETWKRGA